MQDYLISRFNTFSLDTEGLTVDNLSERINKDFRHVEGSNTLVICLPGWNQKFWSWGRVKSHVLSNGASFLAYEFPKPILSNDHVLTRKCLERIDEIVRADIKEFKEKYGFSRCVMAGLSLSSSFCPMIYKGNPDITDAVLVVPGENPARDIWASHRSRHLRDSYESQGITLEQLEEYWHNLAAENNMPADGTRVSIHLGRQDKIAPYELSQVLIDILKKRNIGLFYRVYPLSGHYLVSYRFLLFPAGFIDLTP